MKRAYALTTALPFVAFGALFFRIHALVPIEPCLALARIRFLLGRALAAPPVAAKFIVNAFLIVNLALNTTIVTLTVTTAVIGAFAVPIASFIARTILPSSCAKFAIITRKTFIARALIVQFTFFIIITPSSPIAFFGVAVAFCYIALQSKVTFVALALAGSNAASPVFAIVRLVASLIVYFT